MAAGLAEAQRNAILNAIARNTSYSVAAFWLKLHTGDPGAAGTANAAGETARQQVTFGSAAASGSVANTAAVTWTAVSTTETVSWWSVWTASSAGTHVGNIQMTAAKSLTAGDNLNVAIGALTLTVAGT